MNSFLRPVLHSLLCGVILLGHLPAWLHVASCDDHNGHLHVGFADHSRHGSNAGHRSDTGDRSDTGHRSGAGSDSDHCCDHEHGHGQDGEAAVDTLAPSQPASGHDHDPDACVICHTLAMPNGVLSATVVCTASEPVCLARPIELPERFTASDFLLPPLRGPPRQETLPLV